MNDTKAEAEAVIRSLRLIHRGCVSLLAAGDVPAARLVDFVIDIHGQTATAQTAWGVINARGFSANQIGRMFEFLLDADVPANFAAALGAVKTASDAVGPAYNAELAAIHGEVERSYNDVTDDWDDNVVTKAQRPNFETAVITLRDSIASLVS